MDEEIHKQNRSKLQVAKRCRFDRKTLYRPKNNRYMCVVYFARLCTELNVSADYLLFGDFDLRIDNTMRGLPYI